MRREDDLEQQPELKKLREIEKNLELVIKQQIWKYVYEEQGAFELIEKQIHIRALKSVGDVLPDSNCLRWLLSMQEEFQELALKSLEARDVSSIEKLQSICTTTMQEFLRQLNNIQSTPSHQKLAVIGFKGAKFTVEGLAKVQRSPFQAVEPETKYLATILTQCFPTDKSSNEQLIDALQRDYQSLSVALAQYLQTQQAEDAVPKVVVAPPVVAMSEPPAVAPAAVPRKQIAPQHMLTLKLALQTVISTRICAKVDITPIQIFPITMDTEEKIESSFRTNQESSCLRWLSSMYMSFNEQTSIETLQGFFAQLKQLQTTPSNQKLKVIGLNGTTYEIAGVADSKRQDFSTLLSQTFPNGYLENLLDTVPSSVPEQDLQPKQVEVQAVQEPAKPTVVAAVSAEIQPRVPVPAVAVDVVQASPAASQAEVSAAVPTDVPVTPLVALNSVQAVPAASQSAVAAAVSVVTVLPVAPLALNSTVQAAAASQSALAAAVSTVTVLPEEMPIPAVAPKSQPAAVPQTHVASQSQTRAAASSVQRATRAAAPRRRLEPHIKLVVEQLGVAVTGTPDAAKFVGVLSADFFMSAQDDDEQAALGNADEDAAQEERALDLSILARAYDESELDDQERAALGRILRNAYQDVEPEPEQRAHDLSILTRTYTQSDLDDEETASLGRILRKAYQDVESDDQTVNAVHPEVIATGEDELRMLIQARIAPLFYEPAVDNCRTAAQMCVIRGDRPGLKALLPESVNGISDAFMKIVKDPTPEQLLGTKTLLELALFDCQYEGPPASVIAVRTAIVEEILQCHPEINKEGLAIGSHIVDRMRTEYNGVNKKHLPARLQKKLQEMFCQYFLSQKTSKPEKLATLDKLMSEIEVAIEKLQANEVEAKRANLTDPDFVMIEAPENLSTHLNTFKEQLEYCRLLKKAYVDNDPWPLYHKLDSDKIKSVSNVEVSAIMIDGKTTRDDPRQKLLEPLLAIKRETFDIRFQLQSRNPCPNLDRTPSIVESLGKLFSKVNRTGKQSAEINMPTKEESTIIKNMTAILEGWGLVISSGRLNTYEMAEIQNSLIRQVSEEILTSAPMMKA